jgi:hypothetical protein
MFSLSPVSIKTYFILLLATPLFALPFMLVSSGINHFWDFIPSLSYTEALAYSVISAALSVVDWSWSAMTVVLGIFIHTPVFMLALGIAHIHLGVVPALGLGQILVFMAISFIVIMGPVILLSWGARGHMAWDENP